MDATQLEAKLMNSEQKLQKRRLKFSKTAKQHILEDALDDKSLLSRSDTVNDSIKRLQRDQEARKRLLLEIETIEQTEPDSDRVEHGLRKLREVIVSVSQKNCMDSDFVELAGRVCEKTTRFYCRRKEVNKCYPSLHFYSKHLLPQVRGGLPSEIASCCALYVSHVDQDLLTCLRQLNTYKLDAHHQEVCLTLSLAYCIQDQPASNWFRAVSQLRNSSLLREFVLALPAFHQVRTRALQTISKSYNQLSLSFIDQYWYHGLYQNLESDIADRWMIETTNEDIKIVKFKKLR